MNICKGLEILLEVKWIEIDLSRNIIEDIVFIYEKFGNRRKIQ